MGSQAKRDIESNNRPNDALRLLYFRRVFGLTQKQIADLLEIRVSSYRAYESGRTRVPLKVGRKVASISPVQITPMDPNLDPKEIYVCVRRAHPEDFCFELRMLLPKIASSERQCVQTRTSPTLPEKDRGNLKPIRFIRKNRDFTKNQRREFPLLLRLYCEWRDASFCASAVFVSLWIICLQLSVPLGMFTHAASVVGVGSLTVFFLLLTAVYQDIFVNFESSKAS